MKNLFPKNPIIEILNKAEGKVLLFTPLDIEQHNAFTTALQQYLIYRKGSSKRDELDAELETSCNVLFKDIIAIGDTKIKNSLASTYIESTKITINDTIRNTYKCFINKDWKRPTNRTNTVYHEDGGGSWNCLMGKLAYPKYGIIYTIDIIKMSKFKLNGKD